jgi:hypothetical protein
VLYRLSYTWLTPGGGARTRNHPIDSRRNPYLRSRPADRIGLSTTAAKATVMRPSGRDPAEPGCGLSPRPCGHMIRRNPRLLSRPTIRFSRSRTARHGLAARPGLEHWPPASGAGVVPLPPPRAGLNGEARTPNPRLPTSVRFRLRHVQMRPGSLPASLLRTDGGDRTHTGGGLSAVPLTRFGYVSRSGWTGRGSNPQPSPCKGVALSQCATGPPSSFVWAGGGDRTRSLSGTGRASFPSGPRRQSCYWVWPQGVEP